MGLIDKTYAQGDVSVLPQNGTNTVNGAHDVTASSPVSHNTSDSTLSKLHAVGSPANVELGMKGGHTFKPKKEFDLDFSRLSSQGFFVPTENANQLSLELRVLKRRLLRKLGFLRSNGARPGLNPLHSARDRNLVMVTSTRPAEGKTFTAMNLALSLSIEDDISVTLVDGDAPRPKIQSHFGLREPLGLTDLIMDPELSVNDVCLQGRQAPLTFLPEGRPVDRPGDLFGSAQAQKLLENLSMSHKGKLVIIDVPPVLATTEAIILAPYVDEILFVVEADATPEQAITTAIEELLDVNPNVNLVLNKCLIGAGGAHYGSYSDYYPRGSRQVASSDRINAER